VNPNGLRVIEIMLNYGGSAIQSANQEWQHTAFWEPSSFRFSFVLFGAILVMLIRRRAVRLTDWLLWVGIAFLSLWAVRNVLFMGMVGSVILFSYLPSPNRPVPAFAPYLAAFALLAASLLHLRSGEAFQF